MDGWWKRKITWAWLGLILAGIALAWMAFTRANPPAPRPLPTAYLGAVGAGVAPATLETNALPLSRSDDFVAGRQALAVQGGAIQIIGDRVVILDRLGRLFVYDHGRIDGAAIAPLPMNVEAFRAHAGFPLNPATLISHDLKFDPAGRRLFASFEAYDARAKAMAFEIAAVPFDPAGRRRAGPWSVVLKGPPLAPRDYYSGDGAGGKMQIRGDDLFFAMGDYNLDRGETLVAEQPDGFLGKTFKYGLKSRRLDRLTMGQRVPEGLAFDARGRLWETEHGPRGGDKLNLIVRGANFGWPFETPGRDYMRYKYDLPGHGWPTLWAAVSSQFNLFTAPVYAWTPSIAPSALIAVTDFDPGWNGDLLVGSLKAQSLYRMRLREGRVLFAEPIWIGARIRDIDAAPGQIVLWTDDGSLVFLTPAHGLPDGVLNRESPYRQVIFSHCVNCHAFTPTNPFPWAPSLRGVYGRPIAADAYPHYSRALKTLGRAHAVWDEGALTAFLTDPAAFAPGATMPAPALTPAQIAEIVAGLKTERAQDAPPP